MKMIHFFVSLWIIFIMGLNGCTLPSNLNGEWHDSSDTQQDITITRSNNYVEGWNHVFFNNIISSWTCVDEDTSNNLLLFKSNQAPIVFGASYVIYRCIKFTKQSDFSYSYLVYADIESHANNKRVLAFSISNFINTSSGCSPSAGLPSAIETVVLVKKGYIKNAALSCPSPFLGSFNYLFNDGSSTHCDGTSDWDVCSDRTRMVVNYNLCSTAQFYSNGGVAYCAYSTSVGSTYYVTVVNADSTVDFTTTFRFTCYAVTSSGGHIYASDSKGSCVQNQSPYNKSATGSGTLIFSPYKICTSPLEATVETSSDNISVIAGSLIGVVLLVIAIVVAGIWIYLKQETEVPHRSPQ